jgi:hypothetical protein
LKEIERVIGLFERFLTLPDRGCYIGSASPLLGSGLIDHNQ